MGGTGARKVVAAHGFSRVDGDVSRPRGSKGHDHLIIGPRDELRQSVGENNTGLDAIRG